MQPSKLYPQHFIDYIDCPLPPLQAYRELLGKCEGKQLNDLFQTARQLMAKENSAIELERIRSGFVYMQDKIPLIVDSERFWVERSVEHLIPKNWTSCPVDAARLTITQLAKELEFKIIDRIDSQYMELITLSKNISEHIAETRQARLTEHPKMKVLLENSAFCRASCSIVSFHAFEGKRKQAEMVCAIVGDFKQLIGDFGFLIGSRLEGIDRPYLTGDGELDLIEAALYAAEGNLRDLVIRFRDLSLEEDEELSGEDQFYFMNICNALSLLTGEQLL